MITIDRKAIVKVAEGMGRKNKKNRRFRINILNRRFLILSFDLYFPKFSLTCAFISCSMAVPPFS